ncbi:MAG: hypothetical protein IPL71_16460 [Anaerolineales bacterium]|uniref:hypothetical protein n=1 Tax=Candidatus Villigracilis proximus TaxID=3140683 RepID=UPI003136F1AB|nr:hypothetical protein [Anaerolineales bacterium]
MRAWIFPFEYIVGRRILLNTEALRSLEACGMPVPPALLEMVNNYGHSQDSAFSPNPELKDYRIWLAAHGKTCYMKWLLSNPIRGIRLTFA